MATSGLAKSAELISKHANAPMGCMSSRDKKVGRGYQQNESENWGMEAGTRKCGPALEFSCAHVRILPWSRQKWSCGVSEPGPLARTHALFATLVCMAGTALSQGVRLRCKGNFSSAPNRYPLPKPLVSLQSEARVPFVPMELHSKLGFTSGCKRPPIARGTEIRGRAPGVDATRFDTRETKQM